MKHPRNQLITSKHEYQFKNVGYVAISMVVFGVWHVGACLAQVQGQPQVSYAVYGTPLTGNTIVYPQSTVSRTQSQVVPASFASSVVPSPSMSLRNWAMDVSNAKLNLRSERLPDIGIARQRLDQAMMQLENFLATSPQHQANWLAFLTWNDLRNELNKSKPDQEKLTQIEKTFRQNYFGLELHQFTKVRDALKNYAHALRYSTDRPKTIEILNNRLTKLSEQVQLPGFAQDFAKTRDIGQTIAYLIESQQANDLVSAIRSNYSRANFRVLISSRYVAQKFSRPVYEPNPVNEEILGTQIVGQSITQGFVTPQLLDNPTNAAIRLNMNGNFSSQNIGYNRSVKLHTQGYGSLAASETIALTDQGLVPLNDTSVDAGLSSQIDNIEARLRLVRRIASKQAAKQKPEADAIAEGRIESRLRDQFHNQLVQQIIQANEKIKTPDLPVLKRLGLANPKRNTWSSPKYLALLWKQQEGTQLAAPASCPLYVDHSGITVQLHESMISNLTDPILAGRILRSSEMDGIASQFGNSLGIKPLPKQDNEQPWAITMENYHPVEVQLDNSLVTFRIRTTKLDRGDQALDQPASIEASYKIVLINGAIQLERDGDVKIEFAGKQQRGVRAVTLRSFMKKKLEEVFKEKLFDNPVRITDRLPNELKDLQLASIEVDDGWMQAHLR